MNTPMPVITTIASYLPSKILSNDDMATMVDTSDEWITTRTGIRQRHIAASNEFASSMGTIAAQRALEKASLSPPDIDLIIVTTMTPDYLCPSTATLIQNSLGATKAAAFDLSAACSGFIYGLSVASAYIRSKMYKTILLISSEKNSAFIDFSDRNTCVLFGDGASACIITAGGPGLSIRNTVLGADGEGADLLQIKAGGCRLPSSPTSHHEKLHVIQMNGKEIFKHAVRRMEEALSSCLAGANLSPDDIRWLIPHQANIRIIEALAKRFQFPQERVAITLDTCANTSSSTIPIALQLLIDSHAISPGDRLLLTAFGGGLTWGATLLEAS